MKLTKREREQMKSYLAAIGKRGGVKVAGAKTKADHRAWSRGVWATKRKAEKVLQRKR